MNIEAYRTYCICKKGVSESFPFDEKVLVFKVMNKMFALTDINGFESINLKCNPEKAIELRATYPAITPGYHMNKQHWNTILMDGSLPDNFILEMIDESYNLVVSTLTKKQKDELR